MIRPPSGLRLFPSLGLAGEDEAAGAGDGGLWNRRLDVWVFITGGCSRRGCSGWGLVLYNKTAYNII